MVSWAGGKAIEGWESGFWGTALPQVGHKQDASRTTEHLCRDRILGRVCLRNDLIGRLCHKGIVLEGSGGLLIHAPIGRCPSTGATCPWLMLCPDTEFYRVWGQLEHIPAGLAAFCRSVCYGGLTKPWVSRFTRLDQSPFKNTLHMVDNYMCSMVRVVRRIRHLQICVCVGGGQTQSTSV